MCWGLSQWDGVPCAQPVAGCCAGKFCGLGLGGVSVCTQHRTFNKGLLCFFQILVQGRLLPSFFRKDGIDHYIQFQAYFFFSAPVYLCVCYLA